MLAWLDDRTGFRDGLRHGLGAPRIGGPRWAYVFGAALVALLMVEAFTGALLSFTYAPTIADAWASVFFIDHRVTAGWLIRGIHARAADALVVVMALHVLQVVVYGSYKRPREVTYWLGLLVLGLVLGLIVTGSRLAWDQRTYWALRVELNLVGAMPVIGDALVTLATGGPNVGQLTLTRLAALHTVVLPAVLTVALALSRTLQRRHGQAPPPGIESGPQVPYFPGQFARDVAFATVVIGLVATCAALEHGAPLDAPADPARDYPARPEWYILGLFKLRELLPSSLELLATLVLPAAGAAALVALPLLDRSPARRVRERLVWVLPVVLGFVAMGALTAYALYADAHDEDHRAALATAGAHAARSHALAARGVPPAGPLAMLDDDPLTRGRDVYEQYCASCHVLDGSGERFAPDHTGFGSRSWNVAFLKDPNGKHFFAPSHDAAVKEHRDSGLDEMESMTGALGGDAGLQAVAEFLFSLGHERQDPAFDRRLAARGESLFRAQCLDCHVYQGDGNEMGVDAPDLTGYASRTWIRRQIAMPAAPFQYGEINEMPAFGEDLSEHDLDMVAAYVRLQRFSPFRPTDPPPPRAAAQNAGAR